MDLWLIGGSICQGYMCILLYVKLIECNGFAYIYARLEEGHVIVLHRSLVECRGCMLLYMQNIWCSGFPEIYAQLEEGVGSICHGNMCIVLYMKLISVSKSISDLSVHFI